MFEITTLHNAEIINIPPTVFHIQDIDNIVRQNVTFKKAVDNFFRPYVYKCLLLATGK